MDRKRYEGYFYRGKANFSIGNIKAALIDFEEAKEKGTDNFLKK